MTFMSAHLPHVGKKLGESIPRPRTLVDTNDSLRARAVHTMVAELDLTVTNTWMNADTEQELFTRSSWSNPEDSLTQMDFIMTSRKLEMKHVKVLDSDWFKTDHRAGARCSFDITENEIHDEEWSELAWLGARRLLAQSGAMAPLLMETARTHKRMKPRSCQ